MVSRETKVNSESRQNKNYGLETVIQQFASCSQGEGVMSNGQFNSILQ